MTWLLWWALGAVTVIVVGVTAVLISDAVQAWLERRS